MKVGRKKDNAGKGMALPADNTSACVLPQWSTVYHYRKLLNVRSREDDTQDRAVTTGRYRRAILGCDEYGGLTSVWVTWSASRSDRIGYRRPELPRYTVSSRLVDARLSLAAGAGIIHPSTPP